MIEIKDLVIKLDKLTINYPDYLFQDKKIIFIKGKNGTGKTMLLKAFAGLLEKSEGEIITNDFITYVAQEPYMFNKTVFENIVYPLRIRNLNIEEYKDLINNYCQILEIDNLLDRNAKPLSSGEKMKVSIVRALIFNPGTILLDEPTSYLDVESIYQLGKLIQDFKDKINFIIVSHDVSFMEKLEEDSIRLEGQYVYRKND